MRIGARVPSRGPMPQGWSYASMAMALEDAGFQSVWCSDHVVMPGQVTSHYPFSSDGAVPWDLKDPWYDPIVAMTMMAVATTRIEVGVGVLVLGLRRPVVLAKQLATLDALESGRIALGVGAGWLAEEFTAVGAQFQGRGQDLERSVKVMRDCWSGTARLPDADGSDFHCYPRPLGALPVLVGGMSEIAMKRAGRIGDGWIGSMSEASYTPGSIATRVNTVRDAAVGVGRDPAALRMALRIGMSRPSAHELVPYLPGLAAVGINELLVDVSWSEMPDLASEFQILCDAAADLGS